MSTERVRRSARGAWLLAAILVARGCAAPHRIEVPPALPNTAQGQFLKLRWAIQ